MELTFRTAGIGDLELLPESRLRAIRTYRHLSETAPLPQELPDAVRDYYRQALASGGHIAFLALAGERLAATGGLDLRRGNHQKILIADPDRGRSGPPPGN